MLIDFENLATGCEKEKLGRFDLRVVMRRMKDKGRILVARAYADWGQWNRAKHELFEQGVAMVEMSTRGTHAKNRADMALCVDAMELAYTREYVDTFVILSGDSDFTPLVTRLKELNKRVIGCGTRGSSSQVFANLCDEFFFYETLKKQAYEAQAVVEAAVRGTETAQQEEEEEDDTDAPPEAPTQEGAYKLLLETLENLQRDEASAVHGSVIKSSIKRKVPTFNEVELGFRTFTRFLESAQEKGLVTLSRDERAGGYRVELGNNGGRRGADKRTDDRGGERRDERRADDRGGERRDERRADDRGGERRDERRDERRADDRGGERRDERRAEDAEAQRPAEGATEGTGRRRRRRSRRGSSGEDNIPPLDLASPEEVGMDAGAEAPPADEEPLLTVIGETDSTERSEPPDDLSPTDLVAPVAAEPLPATEAAEAAPEEAPAAEAKPRRRRTRSRRKADSGEPGPASDEG